MNDFADTRDRLDRTAAGKYAHCCQHQLSRRAGCVILEANEVGLPRHDAPGHTNNAPISEHVSFTRCRMRAELHGPGRVAGLRRWVSFMQALSAPKLQPLYTSSVSSSEGDWQTLTQVRGAHGVEQWLPAWVVAAAAGAVKSADHFSRRSLNADEAGGCECHTLTAHLGRRWTPQARQVRACSWPCMPMTCGLWTPLLESRSPSERSF